MNGLWVCESVNDQMLEVKLESWVNEIGKEWMCVWVMERVGKYEWMIGWLNVWYLELMRKQILQ